MTALCILGCVSKNIIDLCICDVPWGFGKLVRLLLLMCATMYRRYDAEHQGKDASACMDSRCFCQFDRVQDGLASEDNDWLHGHGCPYVASGRRAYPYLDSAGRCCSADLKITLLKQRPPMKFYRSIATPIVWNKRIFHHDSTEFKLQARLCTTRLSTSAQLLLKPGPKLKQQHDTVAFDV